MRLILILIVTHIISAQDYNGVIIKYDGFENVTTEPNWKVCYLKFVLENNSGQEIEYSGWDDQDLLQIFVPNNNGFTKVKFGVCGNWLKRIKVAGGKKATLKLPVMWYNINTGWGDLKYPN